MEELNLDKVEVNSLAFSSINIQGFGAETKVIGVVFG